MAATTLIKWSGDSSVVFSVSANEIRAFNDLKISASCDTKDQTTAGEKYKVLKNSGPYEVSMNAILHRALGVDVKAVATAMTEAARKGKDGYLYCGSAKLFTPKFILTKAEISDIEMSPSAKWVQCSVSLTFTQCEKYGTGTDSGDGKGGGNGSGKAKPVGYVVFQSGQYRVITTPSEGARKHYTVKVMIGGKWYWTSPAQQALYKAYKAKEASKDADDTTRTVRTGGTTAADYATGQA